MSLGVLFLAAMCIAVFSCACRVLVHSEIEEFSEKR